MTSQDKAFAAPGSALAAYRSAMARVEPDEAFLARARQAIEAEAAGALPAEKAENTAEPNSAPRRRFLQQRPGPGFKRRGMRRLAPLATCLGLAALSLLAVPAAYLLTYRAGFSGSAPENAYQMMDEAGGQAGAVQSSPAAAAFDDTFTGQDTAAVGDAPAEAPAGAEGNPQAPEGSPAEDGLEYREEPSSAWSGAKAAKAPDGKHMRP